MNKEKDNLLTVFLKKCNIDREKGERILIVFLLGIFFLLIASPVSGGKNEKNGADRTGKSNTTDGDIITSQPDTKKITNDEYISYLENKLEQTIRGMEGAGRVKVMITLKDGGEKVLDKNRPYESTSDTSKEEGKEEVSEKIKSEQETVLVEQDGNTGPIVVKEQYPDVCGVVVLCEGGSNPVLSEKIKEAVGALFSLETHKIVVAKLSSN